MYLREYKQPLKERKKPTLKQEKCISLIQFNKYTHVWPPLEINNAWVFGNEWYVPIGVYKVCFNLIAAVKKN